MAEQANGNGGWGEKDKSYTMKYEACNRHKYTSLGSSGIVLYF